MKDRTDEVDSVIVAFRCPKDLVGAIEQQAAVESISKSDVARRAVLRETYNAPRCRKPTSMKFDDSDPAEPKQNRYRGLIPYKPGQSGNPAGRQLGSRNKLAQQYLDDSYKVWKEEGIDALRKCARNSPARYIAVMAALIPQHFKVEHERTIAGLSIEELREQLREAQARLIASGVELPVIEAEVVEVEKVEVTK